MQQPRPVRRRSNAAFTLIELLTVIAIIGILAAIIIPTVSKVRQSAKNAECVAQLREWGRVIQLYAQENKGNYYVGYWASDNEAQAPNGIAYKSYFTKATTELFRMRYCPADPETPALVANGTRDDPRYAIVQGSIKGNISDLAPADKVPLFRANNPSQYMLMVDCVKNSTAILKTDTLSALIAPATPGSLVLPTDSKRHGAKFNAVFGDGSIKRITYAPTRPSDPTSLQLMRTTWFQLY